MINKSKEQLLKENKEFREEINQLKKLRVELQSRKTGVNNDVKESEEFHRTLFEMSPSGILLEDSTGTILDANPAMCKSMGYNHEDLIGQKVHILAHPDNKDQVDQNIRRLLSGESLQFVEKSIKKDGTECFVQINERSINLPNGEIGIISITQDMTKEVQAQLALRESEEKFRSIFTNFSVGTGIVSLDGRFQIVNQKFADIVGYTINELKEIRNDDLTHPEDTIETRANMKLLFEQKIDSFNLEKRLIHKNGNIVWVDLTVKPKFDSTGEIESVIGVVQDITERKKAEKEIIRLAAVVEQAVESIVITDIDGTIRYVNAAFEKITGYKKSEAIGQNPRMLKSGKQGKEFYKDLWSTILSGNKWQGVIVNKRKNGSFYYEKAVIFPIKNEYDKVINFTAIMRDITLERKLEQ
ncbi:MAG: PAS domain S-box protein, partial [Calditrichia bacterium]|nr:PAS domain S-box protein [Calditrichia bacterium]